MTRLTLLPVPEIMKYLNLDDSDKSMVTLLASSVTNEIERYTVRILLKRHICQYMNGFWGNRLKLNNYPVNSFHGIQVYQRYEVDFHDLKSSIYTLSPKPGTSDLPVKLLLNENHIFPRGKRNIRIFYNAGYSQNKVPEDLKSAYCEIIFWILERLKSCNIKTENLDQARHHINILMYSQRPPEGAMNILNSYRRKTKWDVWKTSMAKNNQREGD